MATVGTTAVLLFSTGNRRCSFIVHADADNSDTVNISGLDPTVGTDFEELLPGQSMSFDDYHGDVWAKGEATGLLVSIPFISWGGEFVKSA